MADKKITELDAIATLETTDVLAVVDLTDTTTKKATIAQVVDGPNVLEAIKNSTTDLETPVVADKILFKDVSDSENVKRTTTQAIVKSGITGGTYSDGTVASDDELLFRDVSDSNTTKKATIEDIADFLTAGAVSDFQESSIPAGYSMVASSTWEDTGLTVTFDVAEITDVVHFDLIGTAQNTASANTIKVGYVLDAGTVEVIESFTAYTATAEVPLSTSFNLSGISAGSHTLKIQIYASNSNWEIIAGGAVQTTAGLQATVLPVESYVITEAVVIDDDTFATATSTNVPSAESVKTYVDNNSGGSTSLYEATAYPASNQTITANWTDVAGSNLQPIPTTAIICENVVVNSSTDIILVNAKIGNGGANNGRYIGIRFDTDTPLQPLDYKFGSGSEFDLSFTHPISGITPGTYDIELVACGTSNWTLISPSSNHTIEPFFSVMVLPGA